MFQRTVIHALQDWAQRSTRKPLILRGARQVGKTSVVDMFSKQYPRYLKLNLEIKADRDLFQQNYDIDQLIAAIYFHLKAPKIEGERTLLFIDEIQTCPEAAAYLRYFYENRNEIHVIAAGSLLETSMHQHISFPVGRVEYLFMRPFSFSEFLLAAHEIEAFDALHQVPCPDFAHQRLLDLFHQYTLVGGMPEAVVSYLNHRYILDCDPVYRNLMQGFMDDVEKYASNRTMVQVIRHAIAHAPLISGERIRFHGFGQSNYQSREMGEALRTLERAMLLTLVYPTTATQLPAEADQRKSPRLQFLDIGMINHVAGLQQHYFSMKDLNSLFLGKIIESVVGQELLSMDPTLKQPLKFWVREKSQSQAEVDYLIPYHQRLVPIEVKSGSSGRLKSLMQFMELSDHELAVRFYAGKVSKEPVKTPQGKRFQLINLPYYLVQRLYTYLA